MQNQYDHIGSR